MNRRRVGVAVTTLALATAGFLGVQLVGEGTEALDVCVTSYEDQSGGGDAWTFCEIPTYLKVPNLGTHTENLHDGCSRGINASDSWSDCISSTRVQNLPANYKIVWYQNTSYGNRVYCWDVNGTSGVIQLNWPAVNDLISSYRILGGNC